MYRNKITHADIKIDPELEKLLCPLSEDEFKALEDSVLSDGLQDAVKVWINPESDICYLVDGHNRYKIFDKYGIEIPQDKIAVLDNEKYRTKDDVILYMLQYQLGRRNLTEGQRIEYVLRYEEHFKKKGKQNQSAAGGDKKSVSPNLGKAIPKEEKVDTNSKLAKMAGMSTEKFRQGKVVIKSDNEEVKEKYKRDEISTYKAYREVTGKDKITKQTTPKSDPTPVPKTTADYDKEIADIEAEIAALYEMKTKLIQDRHKAFQADNSELRCEFEIIDKSCWREYKIFFVKGSEKIEFNQFNGAFWNDNEEELLKTIDLYIRLFETEQSTTLTHEEKQVIIAEIVSMKDQVSHDKEERYKTAREQDKIINDAWKKLFEVIEKGFTPQLTDKQRAWLKPVFRDAAFKYHPDVNQSEDATEAMQFINQLKESFGL